MNLIHVYIRKREFKLISNIYTCMLWRGNREVFFCTVKLFVTACRPCWSNKISIHITGPEAYYFRFILAAILSAATEWVVSNPQKSTSGLEVFSLYISSHILIKNVLKFNGLHFDMGLFKFIHPSPMVFRYELVSCNTFHNSVQCCWSRDKASLAEEEVSTILESKFFFTILNGT